jgi:hypothetical protein
LVLRRPAEAEEERRRAADQAGRAEPAAVAGREHHLEAAAAVGRLREADPVAEVVAVAWKRGLVMPFVVKNFRRKLASHR